MAPDSFVQVQREQCASAAGLQGQVQLHRPALRRVCVYVGGRVRIQRGEVAREDARALVRLEARLRGVDDVPQRPRPLDEPANLILGAIRLDGEERCNLGHALCRHELRDVLRAGL